MEAACRYSSDDDWRFQFAERMAHAVVAGRTSIFSSGRMAQARAQRCSACRYPHGPPASFSALHAAVPVMCHLCNVALQVCLGAKARETGRSSTTKGLINDSASTAIARTTLWNTVRPCLPQSQHSTLCWPLVGRAVKFKIWSAWWSTDVCVEPEFTDVTGR